MARILLVEDDALLRKIVSGTLESVGHHVIEAENGAAGLRKFGKEHCDLIITDILMPVKEGLETIVELRAINGQVPILAMSGGGSVGTNQCLLFARKLGASATIVKPFTAAELVEVVEKLVGSAKP